MKKKLLLVDDDLEQLKKLQMYASQHESLDVIVAENVEQGIELATKCKPDFIITDKDMPDGTGNDLANAVKKEYQAYVVGMTGGNPKEFSEDVVDMRLSKDINNEHYETLLKCIAESEDPKRDFEVTTGSYIKGLVSKVSDAVREYLAIDIIVQGYMLAKQIQQGEQPIPGLEVKTLSKEEVDDILDLQSIEIDVREINYHQSRIIKQAHSEIFQFNADNPVIEAAYKFVTNTRVREFIGDLIVKDFKAIEQKKDYEVFHKLYSEAIKH